MRGATSSRTMPAWSTTTPTTARSERGTCWSGQPSRTRRTTTALTPSPVFLSARPPNPSLTHGGGSRHEAAGGGRQSAPGGCGGTPPRQTGAQGATPPHHRVTGLRHHLCLSLVSVSAPLRAPPPRARVARRGGGAWAWYYCEISGQTRARGGNCAIVDIPCQRVCPNGTEEETIAHHAQR